MRPEFKCPCRDVVHSSIGDFLRKNNLVNEISDDIGSLKKHVGSLVYVFRIYDQMIEEVRVVRTEKAVEELMNEEGRYYDIDSFVSYGFGDKDYSKIFFVEDGKLKGYAREG